MPGCTDYETAIRRLVEKFREGGIESIQDYLDETSGPLNRPVDGRLIAARIAYEDMTGEKLEDMPHWDGYDSHSSIYRTPQLSLFEDGEMSPVHRLH